MKQLQVPTSNVGKIKTMFKTRGIVRQVFGIRKIKKYILDLEFASSTSAYEQYVFVSRMSWNSLVNGQNLENAQCVFSTNG